MKCVFVVLAAVLLLCSSHTCAIATDIQKESLTKVNMRSKKLQIISYTADKPSGTGDLAVSCPVIRPVTCNLPASTGSVSCTADTTGDSSTNTVICTVTGTVKGTVQGTVTSNGDVTVTGSSARSGTVEQTVTGSVTGSISVPAQSYNAKAGSITGSASGNISGTVTGTVTGNSALTVTVPGTVNVPVTVALTGTVTVTAQTTPEGSSSTGDKAGKGSPTSKDGNTDKNTADASPATTTTTTELLETTTTSTASPKEGPHQSTEKPDSSNSHVASHVALFIGTIALLSVV